MRGLILRLQGAYNFRDLFVELVKRDLKLKYRRSFLGYIWSVLNPLLIMLVMTVVFSTMFGGSIENFPVYLLTGQAIFSFFSEATNNALVSIVSNGSLIKKTYIPKYIFTISKITSAMINLIFSLAALAIVMLVTNVQFTWKLPLIVLVLAQLYVFCAGFGLLLAQMAVFFRDVQYIYGILLTAWTYLTPIFYPMEMLPAGLAWGIEIFNPMYQYLAQFRAFTLYGVFPEIQTILLGCGYALLFLVIGSVLFYRNQNRFILYI